MEHAFPFIVITLLQLCQAEIPNALPEWYAANQINDLNYSPKPLTEIFSTDGSFTFRSTDATKTSQVTSTATAWTSTTTTNAPSTNPTTRNDNTQTQGTPQLMNIFKPQPPPAMSQVTAPNQPQNLPNRGQFQGWGNAPVTNWPLQTQQPLRPSPYTQSTPQTVSSTPSPQTSTWGLWNLNQPNWLQGNQQGNIGPGLWNLNQQNWLQNQQGVQSYLPLTQAQAQTPIILPDGPITNRPCDRQLNPLSSQRTIVSNTPQTPTSTNTNDPLTITNNPPTNTNQTSRATSPLLTISVKRKGSRTNVLINPSTTTNPTTTKRVTRRNNNYEVCVDSCKNRKDPICASPRGVTPINPDNLKGFPSMCHMACQNSFRNQQYQKVADGRCGKLRTRIRPVGQDKLNRNELNKAEYSVVHNGQETVIEFSQLRRST